MKRCLVSISLLLALGCNRPLVYHSSSQKGQPSRISTVNNDIIIPPNTKISASCSSVNGSIRISEGCRTRKISTVNGSIHVGADCFIEQGISTVNGDIGCGHNSTIFGGVDTVNGGIALEQSQVEGNLSTVHGNIELRGAKVTGDILILGRASGWFFSFRRTVVITLREGAEVQGQVRVQDTSRRVVVRVDSTSHVKGGLGSAKLVKL